MLNGLVVTDRSRVGLSIYSHCHFVDYWRRYFKTLFISFQGLLCDNFFVTSEFFDHQASHSSFFQQKMAAVNDSSIVKTMFFYCISSNKSVFLLLSFFKKRLVVFIIELTLWLPRTRYLVLKIWHFYGPGSWGGYLGVPRPMLLCVTCCPIIKNQWMYKNSENPGNQRVKQYFFRAILQFPLQIFN